MNHPTKGHNMTTDYDPTPVVDPATITATRNVRTREGWRVSGLNMFDDYAAIGDMVDDCIIDHFANILPPIKYSVDVLQVSGAVDDRGTNYRTRYIMFVKAPGSWYYAGPRMVADVPAVVFPPAPRGNTGQLWCCVDCVHWFANGEIPAEMSEAETDQWKAAINDRGDIVHYTLGALGGDDPGDEYDPFSMASCDTCDSGLGGERFAIVGWF